MRFEWVLLFGSLLLAALRLPGMPGQAALYPWLGLFPGLALATRLMPRETLAMRLALAVGVSPLLSSVAAWLLVRAGLTFVTAAAVVAAAGWLACAASLLGARGPNGAPANPGPGRGAVAWALGFAAVLVAVPMINPYIFIRGDSWVHGGIVMELVERGFPPEDARMAGLKLNYVWFFNFFIALLTSLQGHEPFRFMTLLNASNGFATVVLTAAVAARLWGGRGGLGAAVLLTLGLNAGAFVLWPLWLLRAFAGEVVGMEEVMRQIGHVELGTARIIYDLHAPFALMISFLDKLLVGTALNYGYLQISLYLWALVTWFGDAKRAALVWLLASALAMMLFHSVVGMSVLPVSVGVLGVAWLARGRWSWLPSRGALAAAAVPTIAAGLVTIPYMRSIMAGWSPEVAGFEHRFLSPYPPMLWTIATSCFFPLLLLRRPVLEAWRARDPLPVMVAGYALALFVFACIVNLPEHNSVKFVYELFAVCVMLAAPAFAETAARWWRARRPLALAVGALFVVPTALTLHGYAVDRTGETREELHPVAGEEDFYRWVREATPKHSVLVDRHYRDLITVKGRRRLFLGTDQPPERAAFPAPEMRRRQRIMTDLYGPMAALDSTVAGLRTVGRPLYVVFRPQDPPAIDQPWDRLTDAVPGSLLVYDLNGYHVVMIPVEGDS